MLAEGGGLDQQDVCTSMNGSNETRPSPFNGVWALTYSSDFEPYMDALETDDDYRTFVRKALKDFGRGRLTETYNVDNVAGRISRFVSYKGHVYREMKDVPFDTWTLHKYFDGTPIKYLFGREGDSDNVIVRFEVGNDDKTHAIICSEVRGDVMIRTYTCAGQNFMKKFVRVKKTSSHTHINTSATTNT